MVPKFRAWDKESKSMHQILEIIYSNDLSYISFITIGGGNLIYGPKRRLGDDVIIMQSTGLKDKNGMEIFEGDVVNILDSVQVNEIDQGGAFVDAHFDELDEVDYIVFLDGGFKLSRTGFDVSICHYVEEFKIIGNIYENQELLEQADES